MDALLIAKKGDKKDVCSSDGKLKFLRLKCLSYCVFFFSSGLAEATGRGVLQSLRG